MNALAQSDYAKLLSEVRPAVIRGEQQNEAYISQLEALAFKKNPTHAEQELIELLTVLIENFESKNYKIESASPIEVLSELMEAHNMKQKDLVEQGIFETPSVVSEVLSGKRDLTKEHIRKLCKHFHVSPAVFFDIT